MKMLKYLQKAVLLSLLIPVTSLAQEQKVVIRIIQGDQSIPLSSFQTNVTLRKKAFKFQLLLDHVEGIHVFASVQDSIYRFTETSPIYDFPYLKLLQLRDDDIFNTNKELNISETGWSYWYYSDSAKLHSFNRKVYNYSAKQNICTKAVSRVYNITEGTSVKLRNLNSPLYILFVAVKEYDDNGRPVKELTRRKLKIDWEEDD